ncbi:MAG: class I SAM-dependent DNA methyltransferase [Spirulina sp.]
MTVFDAYAQYYDLLYQDKDYQAEANFVISLVNAHAPKAKTILELGCGTGRHAEYFVDVGYQVWGVEKSPEMIAQCQKRWLQLPKDKQQAFNPVEGDLRLINLDQKFDVVIALFHVISYQTANQDIRRAFDNVRNHLKPGGLFIFDFWYGPAVLSEKPEIRVKRLENDRLKVIRIAESNLLFNENIVTVNYEIFAEDKIQSNTHVLHECHRMRYFFLPELTAYLESAQLSQIEYMAWLTGEIPSLSTWGVYAIARLP